MSDKKETGFKFIRTTEEGTIERTLVNQHMTLSEIHEEFKYFLRGCGYYWNEEEDEDY